MGCALVSGVVLQGIGDRAAETADADAVPLDAAYVVAAGK